MTREEACRLLDERPMAQLDRELDPKTKGELVALVGRELLEAQTLQAPLIKFIDTLVFSRRITGAELVTLHAEIQRRHAQGHALRTPYRAIVTFLDGLLAEERISRAEVDAATDHVMNPDVTN